MWCLNCTMTRCFDLLMLWLLPFGLVSVGSVSVNEAMFSKFQGINRDKLRTDTADVAVAYLMIDKEPVTYHWISHLASPNVSVFIFVDRPEANHIYKNKHGIYIVSLASEFPSEFGYNHFGTFAYIKKPVTCWDKALFFFSRVAVGYRFSWVMETDVFIPSIQAFHNINRLSGNVTDPVDLIISNIERDDDNMDNWHWRELQPIFLPRPWYHSMACVLGMSRKMLALLDDFATKHKQLQFLEFLPLTLALQNHLIVRTPAELITISHRTPFTCEDILHRSMNWFHPVKQSAEFIGRCIESGEWPLDMLLDRGHL